MKFSYTLALFGISSVAATFKVPELCTDAELAIRDSELATMKDQFQVFPRSLNSNPSVSDGKSADPVVFQVGPLPVPNTESFNMIIQEATAIQARLAANSVIPGAELAANKLETLEDIDVYYKAVSDAGTLDLPVRFQDIAREQNLDEDKEFADRVVNLFSNYLRKCDAEPCMFDLKGESGLSDQEVTDLLASYGIHGSYSDLVRKGRVYNFDVDHVAQYSDPFADHKYVPGGQLIMITNRYRQLTPIAAKLSNGLTYTKLDTAEEWKLAKMALSTAASNILPWDHFTDTHSWMESVRAEALRHLSSKHPLSPLLEHHFVELFGWTFVGAEALLKRGTNWDQLYGLGAEGSLKYLEHRGQTFEYKTFEEDISDRGLEKLSNFYYYKDALRIKRAIRNFVSDYIMSYYIGTSGVSADTEVQNWAAAAAGHIVGVPSTFETESELIEFVTEMIFRLSVQHHAQNNRMFWDATIIPESPPALYKDLPSAKGEAVDIMSYLPNDSNAAISGGRVSILKYMGFGQTFASMPLTDDDLLGNSYANSGLDLTNVEVANAITKFQARLKFYDAFVAIRNVKADYVSDKFRYDLLRPSKLPYGVWI